MEMPRSRRGDDAGDEGGAEQARKHLVCSPGSAHLCPILANSKACRDGLPCPDYVDTTFERPGRWTWLRSHVVVTRHAL
jgi:hypothetical protein